MNRAQELRSESDYGDSIPDSADVTAYVAEAERFVATVKAIVSASDQN